jgi:hypothetical protein
MTKTSVSGWAAAGMKPPPNAYQLFARDLRAAASTPAEVKSSVPKFSTYCSTKWAAASAKTVERFNRVRKGGGAPLGPPQLRGTPRGTLRWGFKGAPDAPLDGG